MADDTLRAVPEPHPMVDPSDARPELLHALALLNQARGILLGVLESPARLPATDAQIESTRKRLDGAGEQ